MLKIRNLRKAYGGYHALNGLDMEIADGALYGLVGPNGAGNTTALRIMTWLLQADSGSVEIDGMDAAADPYGLREKIGYVPDSFGVYDNLKVSEYMEFFASCYGMEGFQARKRSNMLLEQVGLGEKADFFVESLSRGMKQRLGLARALLHNPSLLIMDEPTSGLDPRTRIEFRGIVRELNEQGKTILISSHILSELSELCSHIGIIESGKMVISGSMNEIVERIQTSRPVMITIHKNIETALNVLKEHPLVRTITVKDSNIMASFTGSAGQESELLRQLIEADVQVLGFTREPGSLEAVFMQITDDQKEKVVLSYEDESGL